MSKREMEEGAQKAIQGGIRRKFQNVDRLECIYTLGFLDGGAAIGVAAALLILFNGRIAGISGIVGGLLALKKGDIKLAPRIYRRLDPAPLVWQIFSSLPAFEIDGSFLMIALAGLIVGIGTRYSSGCTSGHGVCGVSRPSPRSIVATLLFMATGFATVYVIRHVSKYRLRRGSHDQSNCIGFGPDFRAGADSRGDGQSC